MDDRWPEIANEAISISNFNSKFGWNQEDSIEWQYPLMKGGVPTEQSTKCPVTMSVLPRSVRDAGFSLLDYGNMVTPRKTEGLRYHLCLSGADFVRNPVTDVYEEVDGQYFIQDSRVIHEQDGSFYTFSGNEPWGVVNMTKDSIIRFWCTFFPDK
jgi:hypothetical protein